MSTQIDFEFNDEEERSESCISELQLKANFIPIVNCRMDTVIGIPAKKIPRLCSNLQLTF